MRQQSLPPHHRDAASSTSTRSFQPRRTDALGELFGVVGVRAFSQLARLGRTGHLVNESGEEAYLPHLTRLALPIKFIHGAKNECVLPRATEITIQRLSECNRELVLLARRDSRARPRGLRDRQGRQPRRTAQDSRPLERHGGR
jgi:hypothetical protein